VPSLKDIRSRISSVKNTQQITKAMKMVAASKLRRATQAIEGARSYSEKLQELSDELLGGLLKDKAATAEKAKQLLPHLHPLLTSKASVEGAETFSENEVSQKVVGLVVVASDRGLCGAYNANALKFAWKKYNELNSQEGTVVRVFVVGRKAADYFRKRAVETHWFETIWAGRFDVYRADIVTKALSEKFLSGELQEVQVVYTQFESALSQTVKEQRLLPMALDVDALYEDKPVVDGVMSPSYVTEPNAAELFKNLLPVQLRMQTYAYLADSLASEFGARMTAMDSATRNAGDMISKMTLEANRLRQAAITKELMEIIGGAEALKG
jgi:F-type H+-transporting ATPase subunit gamma